jgi:hypothetical protein
MFYGVLDSNFKFCAFVVNRFIKGEIEKPSGQFLGLIVMSHWLGDVWIRIRNGSVVLPLSFVRLENCVYLSHGAQVASAAWRAATRIVVGVGDVVQRTGDGRTGQVLDGRAVERSGGAVCGLHRVCGDEERGFLGWPSKPRVMVFPGLASKPVATIFFQFGLKTDGDGFSRIGLKTGGGFLGWSTKPRRWRVSRFGPQNRQLRFGDLGLKITTAVFWFGPQN